MDKLTQARCELREMDALAAEDSPVHRLHPLCKLLVTICYIVTVVSFPKYDFSGLVVMVLYPVLMFQAAGIQVRTCLYKLRLVLPLVCAVGLVTLGGWIFCRDSVDYSQLLVWALTASVIAQFGDLSLSTVKRMAGVKDFGTLLPGHGGILDRFDSCLFVLPYTLLFVCLWGRFLG